MEKALVKTIFTIIAMFATIFFMSYAIEAKHTWEPNVFEVLLKALTITIPIAMSMISLVLITYLL